MRGRLGLALMLIALGCAPQRAPSAIIAVIGLQNAQRVDRVEVWICNVPADTTDPWFDDLPLRLALTPRNVVERVGTGVSTYFSTISHGQYDVTFAEGATVDATAQDTTQTCARKALDQSSLSANVVLVVANAEHVGTVPGGWGSAGQSALCKRPCPARDSGRVAYVGGADFHPDSATTPRDLIEHELGHALGLPHSGNVAADKPTYDSPIDVMSNSAAGRITSPPAIDAPDTIAINRLALGWLDETDVYTPVTTRRSTASLKPSTGASGTRVVVLPVNSHRVVTVELIVNNGYNHHLPRVGIAVHIIDTSQGTTTSRYQHTVETGLTPGQTLTTSGWNIDVESVDANEAVVSLNGA